MIEEAYKKIKAEEMGAEELLKKMSLMKQALDQMKKGLRHPA